jgi:ubiquitin-protein ligase
MSQSLVKEFNTLNMNTLKLNGLYLKLNNNLDYANMHLMVIGPTNTPYVNGLYHFTIELQNYPNVAPIVYYSSNSNIVISPSINYITSNVYTSVNSNVKVSSNSNVSVLSNLNLNMNGTLNLNYLKKWNNQSNLLLLLSNIKETIFVTEPFANVIPVNTSGNISVILDKYYNVLPLIKTNKNFIRLFYDISKTYLLKNQSNYYYEINGLSGFNGRIVSNILIDSNIISSNFTQLINSL